MFDADWGEGYDHRALIGWRKGNVAVCRAVIRELHVKCSCDSGKAMVFGLTAFFDV